MEATLLFSPFNCIASQVCQQKDTGSLQRPVAHTGSYTMEAILLFSPFLALGSQLCELPDVEAIRRLMSKNLQKDALPPLSF